MSIHRPTMGQAARQLKRRGSTGQPRELLLQQLVELRRVGLAAGGLHHLADEEAEQLVLAGAVLGELARVLRHHLVDGALDGAACR